MEPICNIQIYLSVFETAQCRISNLESCMTLLAELLTCLVSSETLELAKLMLEQKTAVHAHHLSLIISPHIENTMPENSKI